MRYNSWLYQASTAANAVKDWSLARFWVLIRSYKKQPVKKFRGRILDIAWLKFTVAALYRICSIHLLTIGHHPCIFTTTKFYNLLEVVFNSCHKDKFQWWYYFWPIFSADITIQIEMLVCFFTDSFLVRFSNFVSLWCFSLRFRGGRSATTGLTFIPCPHWVLRPHLNCLTLWGCLSETFSAQKPQMATFTTCWLVPIFVKSRALGSVLM